MPSKQKDIRVSLDPKFKRKKVGILFGVSIVYSYMLHTLPYNWKRSMTWSPCVEIAWRCRTSESIQRYHIDKVLEDPICIWAYLPD